MKTLEQMLKEDPLYPSLSRFYLDYLDSGRTHAAQRKQQRGVRDAWIKLALLYGKYRYIHGPTYTITDRSLFTTPYYKWISETRGLCVVVVPNAPGSEFEFNVLTIKWEFDVRSNRPVLKRTTMQEEDDFELEFGLT